MTLTDVGLLVVLVNRHDPNHANCTEALRSLPRGPLVTTWPSFTEAVYLLHEAGGHPAQAALWLLRSAGRLESHDGGTPEVTRVAALMARYTAISTSIDSRTERPLW